MKNKRGPETELCRTLVKFDEVCPFKTIFC